MNDLRDLYNNAYKKFTPDFLIPENMSAIDSYLDENAEGLKNFLLQYTEQFNLEFEFRSSTCLDIGCGVGSFSFFLEDKFAEVKGLDISPLAIATANTLANMKNSQVSFETQDCCEVEMNLGNRFDCIIDSHLLHCLIKTEQRVKYINNIKKHLAPGGRFLLETMVLCPNIKVPVGYYYDEDKTLWVDNDKESFPIRKIHSPREIENFLIEQGFKIDYLFYHNELSFNPFSRSLQHKVEHCPKTLRVCCRLD